MSRKLLAATLLPWAAFAQNSSEPTSITIYNRVEQPLTSALAPVEVITKAEIERRQPRSLVDLLETLPGMQFGTQSGGIGQSSSLFVRGTESDHVLVLLNGRPMAQLVNTNVDFSQLPVSNVQRIEYIRGPRAAIYGSRAIGGVVNIITTSKVNDTSVGVTAGSNDYYAADVSVNQWVTDATRLQLATGYRETRGYDVIPDNNEPDRDGFDSKNLTLGVEHQLNQNWTIDANYSGWKNNTDFDDDGSGFADTGNTQYFQVDAGLSFEGSEINSELNASYSEFEDESWIKGKRASTFSEASSAITRLDGLIQHHYSAQGYALVGIDWQRDRLLSGFVAPDRDNTGVFISAFHSWNSLSIELTGRVDDNEQFGTHGTWQSALSLDLPEKHKATLSYGTAFRAPSFSDLYYPNYSNPDLQPEESQNWELDFTGDYDLLDWRLSVYRNEIDSMISKLENSTENVDVLIRGVEFVVKADTGPVHHTVNYEYNNAKNIATVKQLDRRAKRKFSWIGDIDVARANLFAQVLYVGERNDGFYQVVNGDYVKMPVVMPSYTIWNIGARYPLTSNLTLNGKINNLFDKDYQVAYSYDAPDMEFYVGADYRF
ncbi:TonB-dependent receptor domain-containing protein [Oceanimonas marisflavi]|uniref:TonB-dependent receptor domain-containing protein n=1 Tax=Oceanimonas marisflavi TaxID=2059724 RepID=UPI000D2FD9FF|nr:TonB-dependent receptor [Oceanimonas marisflavi]